MSRKSASLMLTVLCLVGCVAGCSNSVRSVPGNPQPSSTAIVAWGDSMTEGDAGVVDQGEYPAMLADLIGRPVFNRGIGGQTSSQIGVRQGGIPTYVTVVGGSIPTSGNGVSVVFKTGYEPLTSPHYGIQGSILGIEGTITLSDFLPVGTFTFTPKSNSAPVDAPGTPQFVPDKPYADFIPIFWEGRNNLIKTAAGPWGPDQILSDIAAQVATAPTGKPWFVLSVLNENSPAERKGGSTYAILIDLNNSLAATYGSHYLDVRSILVNSYDPSLPTDVTDHENDMIPTSLGAISGQGTLANDIGSTDTSFTVNLNAGRLRAGGTIVVDNENILMLTVSGSTVTSAIRGYGGILSSHSAGASITEHDGTHLNKKGDQVVADAVAAKLR